MSKKNTNNSKSSIDKTSNHYKLNTKAVDRLVNADKKDYSQQTLKDPAKAYRSGFLDRIPSSVKSFFIKFWFFGAICYFIFWGLGIFVPNLEDMIIILSISLGLVTDILVNNILRFIETVPGENRKWMMFPQKRYWTLFANIIYSFVIIFCVSWTFNNINAVINIISGTEKIAYWQVEPIAFGLMCIGYDLAFIGLKRLVISIINDAKDRVNK